MTEMRNMRVHEKQDSNQLERLTSGKPGQACRQTAKQWRHRRAQACRKLVVSNFGGELC